MPIPADWTEFEDDLADAIADSIDMDWNSRDGAKAVIRWLNENAPRSTPEMVDALRQARMALLANEPDTGIPGITGDAIEMADAALRSVGLK